jgi:hypothetical protein
MRSLALLLISACALTVLCSSGCLMRQTVTKEDGTVVSDDYVVKRPLLDAVKGKEKPD